MVKTEEMLKNLEDLINTPSVVGFYPEIHKKLSEMVGNLGYELEFDNKRTAYVRIPGKRSCRKYRLQIGRRYFDERIPLQP